MVSNAKNCDLKKTAKTWQKLPWLSWRSAKISSCNDVRFYCIVFLNQTTNIPPEVYRLKTDIADAQRK